MKNLRILNSLKLSYIFFVGVHFLLWVSLHLYSYHVTPRYLLSLPSSFFICHRLGEGAVHLCTQHSSINNEDETHSVGISYQYASSGSPIFTSRHHHGNYYKAQHCLLHPVSLCQKLHDVKATLRHFRHVLGLTHRSLMQWYNKMTSSTATSPRPPPYNINWLSALMKMRLIVESCILTKCNIYLCPEDMYIRESRDNNKSVD